MGKNIRYSNSSGKHPETKAYIIETDIKDERGRFITQKEFKLLADSFTDYLDHRKLAWSLAHATGIRMLDAVNARFSWFDKDFLMMQMSQCKPHVDEKDGVIHIKRQPRYVPIPLGLSMDLKYYCKYRQMACWYGGGELSHDMRLFPRLKTYHIRAWLQKLRDIHPDKYPFLKDVWKIERHYDRNQILILEQVFYRVAPHCGRSYYITEAYFSENMDAEAARQISGHHDLKSFQRYTKYADLTQRKENVKRRLENLFVHQATPTSKYDKSLREFF